MAIYPRVDMTGGSAKFPDMEQNVLEFWRTDGTFQASIDPSEGC